jgi:hypothetical protein
MTTLPNPEPEVETSTAPHLAAVPAPPEALELAGGEMTLVQWEWMEQALGCSLADFDQSAPGAQVRLMVATVYARRKALDRSYTLDQAENLPMSALQQVAQAMEALNEDAGTVDPQVP